MVGELRDHDVRQQPGGWNAFVDDLRRNRCLDKGFALIPEPWTVIADAELTQLLTWRCPISIQPKVRPANVLQSRSLGRRRRIRWQTQANP